VQRVADTPDMASLSFSAGKLDTDLEGRASSLAGLAPVRSIGIAFLILERCRAADCALRWDVPVTIERGKTLRLELSHLNSIHRHAGLSSTP